MCTSTHSVLLPLSLVSVLMASGCGYLDEELWMNDEEFQAGIGLSGHGSSSSGCGGAYGVLQLDPMSFHVKLPHQGNTEDLFAEDRTSEAEALFALSELSELSEAPLTEPGTATQDVNPPKGSGWVRHFVDVQNQRRRSVLRQGITVANSTSEFGDGKEVGKSLTHGSTSTDQRSWSTRPSWAAR